MSELASLNLLLAVASHFQACSVLSCLGGESDGPSDEAVGLWVGRAAEATTGLDSKFVSLAQSENWTDAVVATTKVPGGGDLTAERTLAVISDEECRSRLTPLLGFGDNVVWLSLEEDFMIPKELRFDSNWLTIQGESGNEVILSEHYRIKGGRAERRDFGRWSGGELTVSSDNKWERRSNMGGTVLIMAVETWYPDVIVEEEDGGKLKVTGYMPEVMENLRRVLNFTIEHTRARDNTWGVRREDGWTGMMGQLVRREVDAAESLAMSPERQLAVDPSLPLLVEIITLIMPVASQSPASTTLDYMFPFSHGVWYSLLATAMLYAICYAVIFTRRLNASQNDRCKQCIGDQVRGCVFFLKVVSQLSAEEVVTSHLPSRRVFLCTCLLTCLVVFQCYVGALTATTTVLRPPAPITSFHDVIERGITVYVHQGTIIEQQYADAPHGSPMAEAFESNFQVVELSGDEFGEKLHLLLSGKSVGLVDEGNRFGQDPRLKAVHEFEGRIEVGVCFGLQKDSELKSAFDYYITKMIEQGVMDEIYHRWVEREAPRGVADTQPMSVKELVGLSLSSVAFPGAVLLAGLGASLLVGMAERGFIYSQGDGYSVAT